MIVNPMAGNGRAAARWPAISAMAGDAFGPFSHAFTERPGHATQLAREAVSQGMERIVAVGGDGTANEVANGLLGAPTGSGPAAGLAVIPCGTGSDFVRSLDLRPGPAAAIARIAGSSGRRIDVGLATFRDNDGSVTQRHFINIATFGLSGTISARINDRSRAAFLPGPLRYLTGTLGALAGYRPPRMRLWADGEKIEREVYLAAVANACFFGGGMRIAPRAVLDDGLFDIVILDAIPRMRLARKIARVYRGTHLAEPEITCLRASHVIAETLSSDACESGLLDLDGENPGVLRAEFRILPRALRLLM